jgi:hypothetical protein
LVHTQANFYSKNLVFIREVVVRASQYVFTNLDIVVVSFIRLAVLDQVSLIVYKVLLDVIVSVGCLGSVSLVNCEL